MDHIEDKQDLWLAYQVGPKALSQSLCTIKGESKPGGQRVYNVAHKDFYETLIQDTSVLAALVVKMAQALDVLQRANLVHSDLKPDNILVHLNKERRKPEQVKLIDFGSSFRYSE